MKIGTTLYQDQGDIQSPGMSMVSDYTSPSLIDMSSTHFRYKVTNCLKIGADKSSIVFKFTAVNRGNVQGSVEVKHAEESHYRQLQLETRERPSIYDEIAETTSHIYENTLQQNNVYENETSKQSSRCCVC